MFLSRIKSHKANALAFGRIITSNVQYLSTKADDKDLVEILESPDQAVKDIKRFFLLFWFC